MAQFESRLITTVEEKLNSITVQDGQLILVSDSRSICLDKFGARERFDTIIPLAKETDRTGYRTPIRGFYFVEETKVLWRYEAIAGWVALNTPAREQVMFTNYDLLPETGVANMLYITERDSYRWNGSSYTKLGGLVWEVIE